MSGLQRMRVKPEHRMLIIIEILRWIVIIVPIYLAVWRFAELRGYTIFVADADPRAQFWGIISGIILGASLLIYLPLKLLTMKYRVKKGVVTGLHWRPSLLTYIFMCAGPVLIIILMAAKNKGPNNFETETSAPSLTTEQCAPVPERDVLDPITTTVLQVMVIGLTLTEWISKIREEHLTYDLVTAMADDFFFAYDVMDFIAMATREEDIYHSEWVYVCFTFAFVAMFKYVPAQPLNITGQSGPRSQTAVLVSMFCCEVPFVTIRLWTLVVFDFRSNTSGSDLLHPIKNIMLIIFDILQLAIIHKHKHLPEPPTDMSDDLIPQVAPQTRRVRYPEQDPTSECNLRANSHWDAVRRRLVNKEPKMASKVSPVVGQKNSGFIPDKGNESPESDRSVRSDSASSGELPGVPL